MMKQFGLLAAAAAAAVTLAAAPALAAVPVGTIGFTPGPTSSPATVNTSSSPNTYTANLLTGFVINGTGGFASVSGGTGTLNGQLTFSSVEGTKITEGVNNFLTFSGPGQLSSYNFSVSSVTTTAYSSSANSSAFGLLLTGTTVDTAEKAGNVAATPSTLTLSFNSTGGSPYSTSGTFSDISAAPEPGTWVLMLGGIGLMGGAMRLRKSRQERDGMLSVA